jgi:hypothetical protein
VQRDPVSSSQIAAIGYDPATKVLEIEFNRGGVYTYADVPAEVHADLMAADSVGRYFSAHVKGVYEFKRVA